MYSIYIYIHVYLYIYIIYIIIYTYTKMYCIHLYYTGIHLYYTYIQDVYILYANDSTSVRFSRETETIHIINFYFTYVTLHTFTLASKIHHTI